MTPKEKAEELVEKLNKNEKLFHSINFYQAKQCALIAVDEIIESLNKLFGTIKEVSFYREVKQEIEKL